VFASHNGYSGQTAGGSLEIVTIQNGQSKIEHSQNQQKQRRSDNGRLHQGRAPPLGALLVVPEEQFSMIHGFEPKKSGARRQDL
jgi:hypothetical protein